MKDNIYVTRPSMPPYEEYTNEIKELWDTRWLTNMGAKHNQLEAELEKYLDVSNVSLVTNGHMALENALAAFELNGEVITTPYTFVSTAHSIVRSGLKPVFCDIRMDNYTMDASKIEALITSKTCAILPVHVYGCICDIQTIQTIADRYKLKVIYDAAHAFGVRKCGSGIAKYGDASVYSFHATKVYNTIEGGAIAYNDGSIEQRIKDIRNFGFTGEEAVQYIGGNSKMNEFQASMGICNLRHIDEEIRKRKVVYEKYVEYLKEFDSIKIYSPDKDTKYNYAYFPVLFKDGRKVRDKVKAKLAEYNIFTRKYFYPLVTDFDCYSHNYSSGDTPNAKFVSERILTLPMYADLDLNSVGMICDIIKSEIYK